MKKLTFEEYRKKYFNCDHNFVLYHEMDKAGKNKYSCRCIHCGKRHPKSKIWIAKKDISPPKLKNMIELTDYKKQLWDERKQKIYAEYSGYLHEIYEHEKEQENIIWWENYKEYLCSNEWKEKRKLVLIRDKYICQLCEIRRATQVHHLYYHLIPNEPLEHLISLCNICHSNYHKIRK